MPVTVQLPERVKKAYLVPGHQKVGFKRKGAVLALTVPELQCHPAVVFEY